MKKIFIILMIIFSPNIKAQDIVGFGGDCMVQNAIVMTKALCRYFGEDSVLVWIKEDKRFTICCSFDDMGHIQKIVKWNKKFSPSFSEKDIKGFEEYLISGDFHFRYCIDDNIFCLDTDQKETYDYKSAYIRETDYLKNEVKTNGGITFVIGFPGMLRTLCPVEKLDKEKLNIIIKTADIFKRMY